MADANWDTTNGATFVKTTYDKLARFAFRPMMRFDACATEKAAALAMRGSPVTFQFYPDMAAATSELNEVTDPEFQVVSPTTKTITLREYGNVARITKKYRGLSFSMPGPDPEVANLIGWNAGLSQDTLARDALVGGTNVTYAGSATDRDEIAAASTLTVSKLRYVVAKLRGASVPGWGGGDSYVAFIHPDVSVDLREETGTDGWADASIHAAPERTWAGQVGRIAGVDVVETPRAAIVANASNGSGTTGTIDAYISLVLGKDGLGKAFSDNESGPQAEFVIGPQIDRLKRHHTFGWYWLGGYGRLREESIWRIESSSSIGANAA